MSATTAYVEHVALRVRDIHWHIRFFGEVFGMTMRDVEGTPQTPRQYWTLGGLQFVHDPHYSGPEGRLAHLGVMCEDMQSALSAAARLGVARMPEGPNWLRLPDGLVVELLQAAPRASVAQARAINPRQEASE